MDMNRALRQVVQTGEVHFGVRQARKALKDQSARLIVVPVNIHEGVLEELKGIAQVPLVRFAGTNFELGTICGKPFSVSALTVLNEGDSDILESVGP